MHKRVEMGSIRAMPLHKSYVHVPNVNNEDLSHLFRNEKMALENLEKVYLGQSKAEAYKPITEISNAINSTEYFEIDDFCFNGRN